MTDIEHALLVILLDAGRYALGTIFGMQIPPELTSACVITICAVSYLNRVTKRTEGD